MERLEEEKASLKRELGAYKVDKHGACYFTSGAFPKTLTMVPLDGSSEIVKRHDERFDFSTHRSIQ